MVVGNKIGEVINATVSEFTAQCYHYNNIPPLGSLVYAGSEKEFRVVGVVCGMETHGLDPSRRVIVRGEEFTSEAEIYSKNPQLDKLMVTDFKVVVTGFFQHGKPCMYLPSRPARIHSFVYLCEKDEIINFTRSMDFLSLLAETGLPINVDEIIAATLRYLSSYQDDRDAFLIRSGKILISALGGDLRRVNNILKRSVVE